MHIRDRITHTFAALVSEALEAGVPVSVVCESLAHDETSAPVAAALRAFGAACESESPGYPGWSDFDWHDIAVRQNTALRLLASAIVRAGAAESVSRLLRHELVHRGIEHESELARAMDVLANAKEAAERDPADWPGWIREIADNDPYSPGA